jgi:uncharacterized protein (DUF2267 family)
VLEALADRICAGEVDDLGQELPAEVRPALERGKARSNGASRASMPGPWRRQRARR